MEVLLFYKMKMESNNRFNLSQRFVMVSAVAALGRNHANSASQVKRMLEISFLRNEIFHLMLKYLHFAKIRMSK